MPLPDIPILITCRPTLVAGDPEPVVGLGPMTAMPTPFRPRQYTQNIQALVGLLRCYAKLDPCAATRILQRMTMELAADIREDHPSFAVNEVPW